MIVDPDFLNHWKTKSLCAAIGTAEALTALLSLWAHCQNRKACVFPSNSRMLAGICQFGGDPDILAKMMVDCGFLDVLESGEWEVHGWSEKNARLIHNWEAGKTGGRPPKNPRDNPSVNPRDTPRDNPWKTQGQTDKIRGDKSREDERRQEPPNPQGGFDLGDEDSSKEKVPTTEQALRIAKLVGRKSTTKWSDKEIRAYRKLGKIHEEDFAAMEAYYGDSSNAYLRRDVMTLLNNWPGEVDRAKAFVVAPKTKNGRSEHSQQEYIPLPEL